MTEQEWLEFFDSEEMLELKYITGNRKLRLFAVGYCRLIWDLLVYQCSREAVAVAERFADNLATEEELSRARRTVWEMPWHVYGPNHQGDPDSASDWACGAAGESASTKSWWAAQIVAREGSWAAALTRIMSGPLSAAAQAAAEDAARRAAWPLPIAYARYSAMERQCGLLRCIFGNPFRPTTLDPAWLTWNDGTVVKLALAIYDDRAFDRLPILADALEEARCDNADILAHCRSGGEHVRGCWVVDLLLGKE